METKIYLMGLNIVLESNGVKKLIPTRSGRIEPFNDYIQIEDNEADFTKRLALADIQDESGNTFATMDEAVAYLTEFIGGFNNGGAESESGATLTTEQETLLNNAIQPDDLADVATSNQYSSLDGVPFINPAIRDNEVPVIFVLGQSNTDGRGNTTDLPDLDTTFNGEVRIWDKPLTRNPANSTINRTDNGVWKDYELGDMVTSATGASATAFGPELQIAKRWRDESYASFGNKQLHIIKVAIGGTSLSDGATDNSWSDTSDSLRDITENYFAIPALRELQLQGINPVCLGIVWGQGESDANGTDAPNYLANMNQFIPDIREKIGFPDAKVLVMGLSNDSTEANWEEVKQAQIDYCDSDVNAVLIPTDGSDGNVAIDRYLDGVGAGSVHYSSAGLLTLGNKYYDNLNFYGAEFEENVDFSFYGSGVADGAEVSLDDFTSFDTYGTLGYVQYPTDTGNVNVLTWIRGGETIERPSIAEEPSPSFIINSLNGSSDVEVVFRMIHDGDTNTKPGVMLRTSDYPSASSIKGYLTQVRMGGGQLTMFLGNSGFAALEGSPVTPTQQPAVDGPYWYKITMIGNQLTVYNSPDGRTWTQQFQQTDDTFTVGDVWFTLFNGILDKEIGNLRVAHCAFDVLIAKTI